MRAAMVATICALVCAGCATQAQRQMTRIGGALDVAREEHSTCKSAVRAEHYFDWMGEKLVSGPVASATLLSLSGMPNDHEIRQIADYTTALGNCDNALLRTMQPIDAGLYLAETNGAIRRQEAVADLLNRRVTYGEFNRRITRDSATYNSEWASAVTRLTSQLQQSHDAELQRRQAASAAFLQYQAQQAQIQALQNLNRPTTTTCQEYFGNIRCTTY